MVSGMLTYGCGQSGLMVMVVEVGGSSEGTCVLEASSCVVADVSLDEVSGVCPEVGCRSSSSSAAAILRLRSMGISIDVLTIHSCRAVRLRIRESWSTSDASAARPQGDVGRT